MAPHRRNPNTNDGIVKRTEDLTVELTANMKMTGSHRGRIYHQGYRDSISKKWVSKIRKVVVPMEAPWIHSWYNLGFIAITCGSTGFSKSTRFASGWP